MLSSSALTALHRRVEKLAKHLEIRTDATATSASVETRSIVRGVSIFHLVIPDPINTTEDGLVDIYEKLEAILTHLDIYLDADNLIYTPVQ